MGWLTFFLRETSNKMKTNHPTRTEVFRLFFIPLKEAPVSFGSLKNVLLGALILCALSVFSPPAWATGFSLGNASDFAVLYEGTGGNTLNTNNGNITGNIGVGGTGTFAASGPGTITGTVEFSAANTGQFSSSNTTYIPALSLGVNPLYSQGSVTTALTTVNNLNSTLGSETGTPTTINIGNTQSQTINASSGTLDGNGNRVFTVSSFSFGNGATLTINGNGVNNVVLNITANGPQFGGTIVLTGGLSSDQVLFNIVGSNSTLQINTNGATEYGTFLDPNGTISMNHSVLDGRIFGGDSSNMQLVSGEYITAPPSVPEPSTILLLGSGLVGLAAFRKRFKKAQPASTFHMSPWQLESVSGIFRLKKPNQLVNGGSSFCFYTIPPSQEPSA
jgi:hypothetical protein